MTHHSRPSTHVAFFHRASVSAIQGVKRVFRFDVESVHVIQISVPGFGHDRQRPPVALLIGRRLLNAPGNHRVAHHADTVRICDHHRAIQESGILHPGCSGHLAIAIEREPGGEDLVRKIRSARQNGGDSGAHRTHSDLQLAFSGDQRRVTNLHALHIRDGIQRSGRSIEGNPQIAGARFRRGEKERRNQQP